MNLSTLLLTRPQIIFTEQAFCRPHRSVSLRILSTTQISVRSQVQARLSARNSFLSPSGATRKLTEPCKLTVVASTRRTRHMRTRRGLLTTSRSGDARGAVCLVSRARSVIRKRARSRVSPVVNERFDILPWRRVEGQKTNHTAGEM